MTDLKNGILEVGGFTITPELTTKDLDALPADLVKVEYSRRGTKFYGFVPRVSAGGVEMVVDPYFNKDGVLDHLKLGAWIKTPGISDPIKSTQMVFEASRKWLKAVMDVVPFCETDDYISYRFEWGKITAIIVSDVHYGLSGGSIEIKFGC